jgi:hypothetical protein
MTINFEREIFIFIFFLSFLSFLFLFVICARYELEESPDKGCRVAKLRLGAARNLQWYGRS